jgi:outer membrane immunogenic protein
MKKILLASMALAALVVSPVLAADLRVKAPPPPPPPPPAWTGCYIGGNAGWVQAETRLSLSGVGGVEDFSRTRDGGAFGAQIGCDYQFASNWVFGIQLLADGTNIDTDRVSTRFPNTVFHADVDRFATITGRFGYAVSPAFLFYGKFGWGAYRTDLTAINTVTGFGLGGGGRNRSGFDAGVGGEWMFAPNWSLWIEWDRIFADDKTVFFPNLAGGTTANVRRDFDKVLLGVNWRFGRGPLAVIGAN